MSIFSYIKKHFVLVSVLIIVVVIIAIIGGRAAKRASPITNHSEITKVTLINAAVFRKDNQNIQANGVVEARSQADVRSQISAPISAINVGIGDNVYTGQVIAELANADLRAQLDQARSGLVIARGQYGGTRLSAIDRMREAYLAADSAVHSQVDQLLLNTTNSQGQGQLYSYVTDSALGYRIRDGRTDLNLIFQTWKTTLNSLSATSSDEAISAGIVLSQKNLQAIRTLFDNISQVLNNAANSVTASAIVNVNSLQAIVSSARGSITTAESNLTSAASSLGGTDSGTPIQAQVKAAEAGVANLEAQLAKSIIRSPLRGKIAALPLHVGELASPGTLLATIVGDASNLKIRAYVSGDDLSRVHVGQSALVWNSIKGLVTNVAPSVDPATRKAEVVIDVDGPTNSDLVIGDNVTVMIKAGGIPVTEKNDTSAVYVVPIQNIKIIPGEAFVYTVDQNSLVVRNPVTLGDIRGDFIEVVSGLRDDMNIISPVYELDEGQKVEVTD